MIKPSPRLSEPTQGDRVWLNETLKIGGKDFFADPHYNPNYFQFRHGKIVYPIEPERLSWQRSKLIKKQASPHRDLWINRVDLFLISVEGNDWERCFTANLAGIDRNAILRAMDLIAQHLPENATADGQVFWELINILVLEMMIEQGASKSFVSPFLHCLATGELEPLNPLGSGDLFTKEALQQRTRPKPMDLRWLKAQARLQEHNSITDLYLDGFGFVQDFSVTD